MLSLTALGTWRSRLVTEARNLYKLSPEMVALDDVSIAARLAVNPMTAWLLLESLQERDKLVIQNGANSAVGRLITQLASLRNINLVNLVRPQAEELETNNSLLLRTNEPDIKQRILERFGCLPSVAFNCVGGDGGILLAKVMAGRGRVITYGGMSGRPLLVPTSALIFSDLQYSGFWLTRWKEQASREQFEGVLRQLEGLFVNKKLQMGPVERIRLEEHAKIYAKSPRKYVFIFE